MTERGVLPVPLLARGQTALLRSYLEDETRATGATVNGRGPKPGQRQQDLSNPHPRPADAKRRIKTAVRSTAPPGFPVNESDKHARYHHSQNDKTRRDKTRHTTFLR